MKYSIVFIFSLLASASSFSGEHALGAHEHGSIKLEMAIEKNVVDLSIDGPAESFMGFEYIPKTKKDLATFKKAHGLWTKNLLTLISFDEKLKCKVTEVSFKQVVEEAHSDIEANAKVTCAQPVSGTKVRIALREFYTDIKKLKVEIIGTTTTSFDITKDVQEITL
jgi:hypothetical protein